MTQRTYGQVIEETCAQHDEVMVLTAENRAIIRELPERLGDRFIDVGISEQTMIGVAAGLAVRGKKPICHALATFLTMRAFEFIRTDVGIPNLPVKLLGFVPGFLSTANGPTHQAIEDIAIMRGIPGMKVFCPSDLEDLLTALPQILTSDDPWYIRYTDNDAKVQHSVKGLESVETLKEGSEVCLLTYGFLTEETLKAAQILEESGHSVQVTACRIFDEKTEQELKETLSQFAQVHVIEDHFAFGGLTSLCYEVIGKHHLATDIVARNLEARWFKPALLSDVLQYEGFHGEALAGWVGETFSK